MKSMIKIFCVFAVIFAIACTKEGATGPAGPAGPAGPTGPAGPEGNANVKMYKYETDFTLSTSLSSKTFTLTGLTSTDVNNSLIVGFYLLSDALCDNIWYNMTGLGCSGSYQSRSYVVLPNSFVYLIRDVDGTAYSGSDKHFTSVKIFVIPASTVINGRTKDPRTMSYEEFCHAYDIKE